MRSWPKSPKDNMICSFRENNRRLVAVAQTIRNDEEIPKSAEMK